MRTAILTSALIAISTGASAQRFPVDDRGSAASIPENAKASGVARKVMEQFAICTYRTARKRVEDRLLAPVQGDPKVAVLGLASSDCLMAGELRFDPTTFRGSLFGAMYRDRYKNPVIDIPSAPPIDYGKSTDAVYSTAMIFADCVVRADSAGSVALVRAAPATAAETEVLNKLGPVMSNCVSQGRSSQMHKSTLRGFIAESLFRLSTAASRKVTR